MPTPSEQKALTFVAMVVLLGGAVRVVRAGSTPASSATEQQALARQTTAVDSAAAASRPRSPKGGRGSRARRQVTDSSRLRAPTGAGEGAAEPVRAEGLGGFPPPGPRIDVDYRSPNPRRAGSAVSSGAIVPLAGAGVVDLDQASAQEIERLPRIGPALARRLVANRDSFGAFGALEALARVKGLGPATRKRLSPLVTFSGRPSSRP